MVRTRSTTSGSLREARNVAAVSLLLLLLLGPLDVDALLLRVLALLVFVVVGAKPFNGCFLLFRLNMVMCQLGSSA